MTAPAPAAPGDGTDPQAVRRALQAFLDQRFRSSPAVRAVVDRVVRGGAGEPSTHGSEGNHG